MRIYKPAPSHGALYILGMAILIVLLSLPVIPAMATPVGPVLIITVAVIMWPLAIAGCLIAWWFRSMQYELGTEALVLRFGPFRFPIKLAEIESVTKRDLAISMVSSMRGPGFALFTVLYADVGKVFMCATRPLKAILLIRTPRRLYGITPADEEAFVADLTARLRG